MKILSVFPHLHFMLYKNIKGLCHVNKLNLMTTSLNKFYNFAIQTSLYSELDKTCMLEKVNDFPFEKLGLIEWYPFICANF